ncbi:hypothetical protein BYT27DRAFT_7095390, partial [Phlegmacium glaucopus]
SLNLQKDLEIIALLKETHYLNRCCLVPKCTNIDLAWEFSQDPAHPSSLYTSCFLTVLDLTEDILNTH